MQVLNKKAKVAIPAAIGAGVLALSCGPAAMASFTVTLSTPSVGTSTNAAGTTIPVQIYEVAAQNNGPDTGSRLIGYDATVTTPGTGTSGALVIDLKADTDGDGLPDANVLAQSDVDLGTPTPNFGSNNNLGTFMNMATTAGGTNVKSTWAGAVTGVWINQFTDANNGLGTKTGSPGETSDFQTSNGPLDSAYTSGTVHSLEADGAFTSATSGTVANSAGVDIMNIVVPTGTTFSVIGQVGGEVGSKQDFSLTNSVVSAQGAVLSLSTTQGAGDIAGTTTSVGTLAVTGHNGSYTSAKIVNFGNGNFSVTNPASTTGNATVSGFSPANDEEVYALAVDQGGTLLSGTALATAILDLQAAATAANPGSTVEALATGTPNITGIFGAAAWNVEVVYPTGPSSLPAFLNWDFSGDTVDPGLQVTAVGVVPEPTGLGVLALGGMGLLARRRRMSRA